MFETMTTCWCMHCWLYEIVQSASMIIKKTKSGSPRQRLSQSVAMVSLLLVEDALDL